MPIMAHLFIVLSLQELSSFYFQIQYQYFNLCILRRIKHTKTFLKFLTNQIFISTYPYNFLYFIWLGVSPSKQKFMNTSFHIMSAVTITDGTLIIGGAWATDPSLSIDSR